MIVENTPHAASLLVHWLTQRPEIVPVFDLDGVLLDASERIDLLPCGALDLDKYRANTTAEKVAQDKELPLISVVHWLNANRRPYHVATARVLCEHTQARLQAAQVRPVLAMGRHGHNDRRGDAILKTDHFLAKIAADDLPRHCLIDDLESNTTAARNIGMLSVRVLFEAHSLQIVR